MKLALAQIDMRLGDIDGICSRVFDQASIAVSQGADMLCVPSPLMTGMSPTTVIEYPNFEHDLLRKLSGLAARVDALNISCIVPAVVSYEGIPVFEAFLLKDGNAIPMRSFLAHQRGINSESAWIPPVFDVAGTRVAVTFDLMRDIDVLPCGCDLLLYFQTCGYDPSNIASAAVASVPSGCYSAEIAKAGLWMACMAPVGAYDETVYTGGSFVMDDAGKVVSAAPCFEEALLVTDIRRGMEVQHIEKDVLTSYDRDEWTWEALRLHVRDIVRERGRAKAAVMLEGNLESSLLAALAVDALGPRNVIAAVFERQDVMTSAQEAAENDRLALVRELASSLHIQLVECESASTRALMAFEGNDAAVPYSERDRVRRRLDGVAMCEIAASEHACLLASFTKTEAALAAPSALDAGATWCASAPFGDVYLSRLEFIARWRNKRSAVLPQALVSLKSTEHSMSQIVSSAVHGMVRNQELAGKVAAVLVPLQPQAIDEALEAHVDKNLPFEDIKLSKESPEAMRALMLLTQNGEASRRVLPLVPVMSARSFAERIWPRSLAWSDLGRDSEALLNVVSLVDGEAERLTEDANIAGERIQSEFLGMLGELFGIPQDQISKIKTIGDHDQIREGLKDLESRMRDAFERGQGDAEGSPAAPNGGRRASFQLPIEGMGHIQGGSTPFFSQN